MTEFKVGDHVTIPRGSPETLEYDYVDIDVKKQDVTGRITGIAGSGVTEVMSETALTSGFSHAYAHVSFLRYARETDDPNVVTFRVRDDWPTPRNCHKAADALDALNMARFGDILRAYADAEDARFTKYGPVEGSN